MSLDRPPRPTDDAGESTVSVIVVAGGRSTRYGSDKVEVLLPVVLDALPRDVRVVCVGPKRITGREVLWAREEPSYAGPLAAVAAGFAALAPIAGVAVVVVIGADMPRAGRAVADLVEATRAAGAAVVVDQTGRPQPLLSAFTGESLSQRLDALVPWTGKPARLLVQPGDRQIPDLWQAADDVDLAEQLPPDIGGGLT